MGYVKDLENIETVRDDVLMNWVVSERSILLDVYPTTPDARPAHHSAGQVGELHHRRVSQFCRNL